jgi:hypothetical protein
MLPQVKDIMGQYSEISGRRAMGLAQQAAVL